jgi:hypothetical protein
MAAYQANEREWVDHLGEHIHRYRRKAVVNYYVALKSSRFVILTGPQDMDKMRLAQGVAQALVGQSSLQWSSFEAHPWWSTHTGHPGHFAIVHARFNAVKVSDLIEFASGGEKQELPFFVGIQRMSRAEIECYFRDLPRGLLWQADASTVPVRLPSNLFVTGTFDVDKVGSAALSGDAISLYAAVVHIEHDDLAVPEGGRDTTWQRADWQQQFISSRVHHGHQARAKLARILPDHLKPLAPLDELRRCLGPMDLPPFVMEKAWLYLANAFDNDGRGLYVEPIAENLAIAQDYMLVQNVLPHIMPQRDAETGAWDGVREYLARYHPHAYAWMQHFVHPPFGGAANRLNTSVHHRLLAV